MARGSTPRLALTHGNGKFRDGDGSQLVRIDAVYAIARSLAILYVHSPLRQLNYQGLSALDSTYGSSQHPARIIGRGATTRCAFPETIY